MKLKVKIFIVPYNYPKMAYHHEIVALCEGFKDLGIEFYGDDDYWFDPETTEYLLKKEPKDFRADIHVYSLYYFNLYPDKFSKIDYSKINVVIDKEDGYYSAFANEKFEKFDLILRTHYNKRINYRYYHNNIQPWAFGLSNRIINQIDKSSSLEVEKRTLVNYRIGHPLREMAYDKFAPIISIEYPIDSVKSNLAILQNGDIHKIDLDTMKKFSNDQIMQLQTSNRHDPEYYKKLNSAMLTFTFGGYLFFRPFLASRLQRPLVYFYKFKKSVLDIIGQDGSSCYFLNQYDSWRYWEALYSNSCPIHVNFDSWGLVFPEMPVNKVHYWGVNGFDFENSAKELLALSEDDILKIGKNGKEWSVKHYGPLSTAQRFLNHINKIKKN